jgi:hypothetical protein
MKCYADKLRGLSVERLKEEIKYQTNKVTCEQRTLDTMCRVLGEKLIVT